MQIKPAWKAAGSFPIQPGCALFPAAQASSHDCFSWWLFNISLPVLPNSLWLSKNMQLFLLTAQLKWIYRQKEQVLASTHLVYETRTFGNYDFFFCQNEETDAHSEFCLWRGLRRGLGFRNGSELLCPWASPMLHRSPPEGCMGALLDVEIAGAQNIYVIVLAVPAKGQLCYENLQPF